MAFHTEILLRPALFPLVSTPQKQTAYSPYPCAISVVLWAASTPVVRGRTTSLPMDVPDLSPSAGGPPSGIVAQTGRS